MQTYISSGPGGSEVTPRAGFYRGRVVPLDGSFYMLEDVVDSTGNSVGRILAPRSRIWPVSEGIGIVPVYSVLAIEGGTGFDVAADYLMVRVIGRAVSPTDFTKYFDVYQLEVLAVGANIADVVVGDIVYAPEGDVFVGGDGKTAYVRGSANVATGELGVMGVEI